MNCDKKPNPFKKPRLVLSHKPGLLNLKGALSVTWDNS